MIMSNFTLICDDISKKEPNNIDLLNTEKYLENIENNIKNKNVSIAVLYSDYYTYLYYILSK